MSKLENSHTVRTKRFFELQNETVDHLEHVIRTIGIQDTIWCLVEAADEVESTDGPGNGPKMAKALRGLLDLHEDLR